VVVGDLKMSTIECNLDHLNGDLIYKKPYHKLFISKRKEGGILIRSLSYSEPSCIYAYDSEMFFFDEIEAEVLFEWLAERVDKEEVKRVCEKHLTK
jgi:hypothetical protein